MDDIIDELIDATPPQKPSTTVKTDSNPSQHRERLIM